MPAFPSSPEAVQVSVTQAGRTVPGTDSNTAINNSKTNLCTAQIVSICSSIINSEHPGGLEILLTDGSVRFLSDTIEFINLKRLACRYDGEPITGGF